MIVDALVSRAKALGGATLPRASAIFLWPILFGWNHSILSPEKMDSVSPDSSNCPSVSKNLLIHRSFFLGLREKFTREGFGS